MITASLTMKVYKHDKVLAYNMFLKDPSSIKSDFDTFCNNMENMIVRLNHNVESGKAHAEFNLSIV